MKWRGWIGLGMLAYAMIAGLEYWTTFPSFRGQLEARMLWFGLAWMLMRSAWR